MTEKADLKWQRQMSFKYATELAQVSATLHCLFEHGNKLTDDQRDWIQQALFHAQSSLGFWATHHD